VKVPLVLVGKAEGVAVGGILSQSRRDLEVWALPSAIPEKIEADVTPLKIAQALHINDIKLPEGVSITWSGEFENQERAMRRLAVIVPVSILIIFLLLFDAFKSFSSALVIIANIPFSVIGGILALWLTGIYLSVSAAIGFIALFGQAVLNGVVMVTLFNQLRASGMPLAQAVREGAMTRLRTVLMTALLASLGLAPMALSTGIGSEVQKPLAVVVIGGLVTATLLVLFVLPVLYLLVSKARRGHAG